MMATFSDDELAIMCEDWYKYALELFGNKEGLDWIKGVAMHSNPLKQFCMTAHRVNPRGMISIEPETLTDDQRGIIIRFLSKFVDQPRIKEIFESSKIKISSISRLVLNLLLSTCSINWLTFLLPKDIIPDLDRTRFGPQPIRMSTLINPPLLSESFFATSDYLP